MNVAYKNTDGDTIDEVAFNGSNFLDGLYPDKNPKFTQTLYALIEILQYFGDMDKDSCPPELAKLQSFIFSENEVSAKLLAEAMPIASEFRGLNPIERYTFLRTRMKSTPGSFGVLSASPRIQVQVKDVIEQFGTFLITTIAKDAHTLDYLNSAFRVFALSRLRDNMSLDGFAKTPLGASYKELLGDTLFADFWDFVRVSYNFTDISPAELIKIFQQNNRLSLAVKVLLQLKNVPSTSQVALRVIGNSQELLELHKDTQLLLTFALLSASHRKQASGIPEQRVLDILAHMTSMRRDAFRRLTQKVSDGLLSMENMQQDQEFVQLCEEIKDNQDLHDLLFGYFKFVY